MIGFVLQLLGVLEARLPELTVEQQEVDDLLGVMAAHTSE